jgi:Ca-activated chloride channel family protein
MKRPLCVAIALALTLAAGCSTRESRQATAPKPAPEVKEELAAASADAALLKDDRAAAGATSVRANEPARLGRERDEGRVDAAPELKQIAANDAPVAQEAVAVTFMTPPSPPPPAPGIIAAPASLPVYSEAANRENYAEVEANPIQRVAEHPVSTFSIDVDSGSYANVRRMLVAGSLPPSDAVRAEEMINYFDYGYAPPASTATPFSVTTELAPAPWNPNRQLLLVGIKGYEVPAERIPAANLVFLIDTSGSMQSPDKIELLKQALAQMVNALRPQDRVSIVTYAGSAGLVLPATPGGDKATILAALEQLYAGGSTNGGAGIELAYATARQNYIDGGVNRVILATDGDFNVGRRHRCTQDPG